LTRSYGVGLLKAIGVLTRPEQGAFKHKRYFALTPCFDASLRFLPIPPNRKTL